MTTPRVSIDETPFGDNTETARAFQAVCDRYGVKLYARPQDPVHVLRVEVLNGGPLGSVEVQGLTPSLFESKLQGWGLKQLARERIPFYPPPPEDQARPLPSGLEQMREQAKVSRAARAEALVPQGATLEERRVRALERIAFALERLADGK